MGGLGCFQPVGRRWDRKYFTLLSLKNSAVSNKTSVHLPGKKGKRGPDFDDDGYKHMVCIEPANATTPVLLEPDLEWTGFLRMTALSGED
jgi:D-hexose-6-phosphate mutarotase